MDDQRDDPFPRSLPQILDSSPQILDLNMEDELHSMGIVDYYNGTDAYDSPQGMFYGTAADNTAVPSPAGTTKKEATVSTHLAEPSWSHSPESSSGSDSSNPHKRKNSSESSSTGGLNMADAPSTSGIMIGADPAAEQENERWMDEAFDFASAASSPVPQSAIAQANRIFTGDRSTKVPTRANTSMARPSGYRSYVGTPSVSKSPVRQRSLCRS